MWRGFSVGFVFCYVIVGLCWGILIYRLDGVADKAIFNGLIWPVGMYQVVFMSDIKHEETK